MSIRTIGRSLLFSVALFATPVASYAQYFSVGVSVGAPPPPLPVYAQPACPGDGYLWVPGYWAYGDDDGYYWVPGTWTLAPEPGLLWTPGYWAWAPGGYMWNAGYWGPHVGFYGGINYGFGYFGTGFSGGYWANNVFLYNGAVTNINTVNTSITNVYYNNATLNGANSSRVSYNGGAGGTRFHPNPSELAATREPHVGWTSAQRQQADMARSTPSLAATANHGRPPIAATPRVALFNDAHVSPAHGAQLPTAPSRTMSGGRSASGAASLGSGRGNTPYGSGQGGNGRTQASTGGSSSTDRPPWASRPQDRPASAGGARSVDRLPRSTARNDWPSASYRPAPTWTTNRGPATGSTYSSSNGRVGAATRAQGVDARYGQYGSPPRQQSSAWTRPGSDRWSGGYPSAPRATSSRAYFGDASAQRWATPRVPASPNRSYAGGAAPHFGGYGSAPRVSAPQGRAPATRR